MQTDTLLRQKSEALVNGFVRSVYNWMAVGLALTGFVAWYASSSESVIRIIYGNSFVLIGLIVVELALVFSIAGMVTRMSPGVATSLFVIYAGLNGLTLSFIFLVYTRASIVSTFFLCGGTL